MTELMQWMAKYVLVAFISLIMAGFIHAQPGSTDHPTIDTPAVIQNQPGSENVFTVRSIFITGNKKTKELIILREVPFKSGDTYQLSELVKKFEIARKQLMNTALFHEVVVALKAFEGNNVDIAIDLRERWYLFPIPYFKFVDRNINQWLVEQHAKLTRVNYGLKVLYNNATGRNDKLNVYMING